MTIKETLKTIFLKIANKLNLEMQEKTNTFINYQDNGINPTAIGANVITNIAIDDSDIVITGENSRSDALRDILDYFIDEIEDIAVEVSLGTGDCIVRPYTDGEHIGLNVIGNNDFVITESIGPFLRGVIMKLDEYNTNKGTYRLFESQTLRNTNGNTVVLIKRYAYEDEKEVPLLNTNWKNIEEETRIISDQLLIGRYKCPTINRDNYNSANGVPITYGCKEIIDNIKEKYTQFNDEFDRKQAVTFIDRSLLKKDSDDRTEKYKMDGHQFVKVRGSMDGGVSDMIQDYSPEIRATQFQTGMDFNFSVLEICCGFSRGIFTSPETAFATATEMKNSLKKTFAFIKKLRRRIESGNKMLFNAIDILFNVNNVTPIGNWDIQHQWSYDYIEQTQERFNQLLQAHAAGALKTSDLTAWVLNLSKEDAEIYVKEIECEETEIDE